MKWTYMVWKALTSVRKGTGAGGLEFSCAMVGPPKFGSTCPSRNSATRASVPTLGTSVFLWKAQRNISYRRVTWRRSKASLLYKTQIESAIERSATSHVHEHLGASNSVPPLAAEWLRGVLQLHITTVRNEGLKPDGFVVPHMVGRKLC